MNLLSEVKIPFGLRLTRTLGFKFYLLLFDLFEYFTCVNACMQRLEEDSRSSGARVTDVSCLVSSGN